MITINLMDDCVARDICGMLINEHKINVLQYPGFVNCISVVSPQPERFISIDDLSGFNVSNFFKRNICLDWNKTFFDFLFSKKSDYLIVSLNNNRNHLLRNGDHIITMSAEYTEEVYKQNLCIDSYEFVSTYDISDSEHFKAIDKVAELIQQHYTPDQVIIHRHYGTLEYEDKKTGTLKSFPDNKKTMTNMFNEMVRKHEDYLISKIKGCHVIEFPDNVISSTANRWGLHMLHYINDYYNYGKEALDIIIKKYPVNEEEILLKKLLDDYNYKFELIHEKLFLKQKLTVLNNRFKATLNVLDFQEEMLYDYLNDQKFNLWLDNLKEEGKTVSILYSNGKAGQVLDYALKSKGINVIFTTPKYLFDKLTTDEIDRCISADIIVQANIHIKNTDKFGEKDVIMISDLFK